MEQKPSIGRIVRYQAFGTPGGEHPSAPRAAVITATYEGTPYETETKVDLAVLNPTGMFFNREVPYSETPKPGHWNWPPRI